MTPAEFRGRPLVLHFFASWCGPCREEAPVLRELTRAAAEQGFAVVGVAVRDEPGAAARFLAEEALAFPVGVDGDGAVSRSYRVIGPPTTFFVDSDGVVRDVVPGPLTEQRVRQGLARAGVEAVTAGEEAG